MPVPFRRVAVAGVLAAAAVAIPVAALALGSDSPGAKTPHPSTTLEAKRAKAEAARQAHSSTTLKAKSAEAGAANQSLTGPAAVAVLAARLGVSTSAARHALQQVGALNGREGVDPAGAAFAAIAHQLGVSPRQLSGALGAVKQSMAGR